MKTWLDTETKAMLRKSPPSKLAPPNTKGFTLVLLSLCAEALAVFHWTLPPAASRWIEISIAAGLATTLLIPVALRRFSVSAAANIIIAASFIVLFTVFAVLGGIRAPVLHWCALMAMLERRKAALAALVQAGELPTKIGNFLNTLTDNNRTAALPAIAVEFHQAREESLGIVAAEITTARPMTDDLEQRARESLERMTGSKVKLSCTTSPELIGGAVTRIGSHYPV